MHTKDAREQLRSAQLKASFEEASSWAALADVLSMFSSTADERNGVSGFTHY